MYDRQYSRRIIMNYWMGIREGERRAGWHTKSKMREAFRERIRMNKKLNPYSGIRVRAELANFRRSLRRKGLL